MDIRQMLIAALCMSALASSVAAQGLYIFPAGDQTPEQQAEDEHACHGFAQNETGVDPDNLPAVPAAPAETAGTAKTAVVGSGLGAVGGGIIGMIAGSTATGALIGAGAGAVAGAVKGNKETEAAEAEQQAAIDANQAAVDEYNRAFAACMTGKNYGVQ